VIPGVTLRRVPPGNPGAGLAVLRLHYSADPERWTPQYVASLRGTYTSDARWRREMEIEAQALEGELLYPEFQRQYNVCESFDVSDRSKWTIWMGLDPHPRTAHAMAWRAYSGRGDQVICGEAWPEFGTRFGPTDGVRYKIRDYAELIQLFESDSEQKPSPFIWARGKRLKVHRRIMDTYGKAIDADEEHDEDYFEKYRKIGMELSLEAIKRGRPEEQVRLNFDPALKGHENLAKAYDGIGQALATRVDSRGKPVAPILRVFEECTECIDEFENVRYPRTKKKPGDDFGVDVGAGSEGGEKILTFQKHVLDCIAYIETARAGFVMPSRSYGPVYENDPNVVR
jgi:hypothetical protein